MHVGSSAQVPFKQIEGFLHPSGVAEIDREVDEAVDLLVARSFQALRAFERIEGFLMAVLTDNRDTKMSPRRSALVIERDRASELNLRSGEISQFELACPESGNAV